MGDAERIKMVWTEEHWTDYEKEIADRARADETKRCAALLRSIAERCGPQARRTMEWCARQIEDQAKEE
jgi:hypothetical protein